MSSLAIGLSTFAAMNPEEKIAQFQSESEQLIIDLNKKSRINSFVRLLTFLLFAYAIYMGWGHGLVIILTIAIFAFLFIKLVNRQSYLREKLKIEKAFRKNATDELEILNGNWRGREDGREFIHRDHAYAADLNVFGSFSLFQYLNRAKTQLSKERVAGWLQKEIIDPKKIEKERVIIAELAENPYFLLRLLSHASFTRADTNRFSSIKDWASAKESKRSRLYWFTTTFLIPAYAIICTFIYAVDGLTFNAYLLTLVLPGAFIAFKLAAHQQLFQNVLKILSDVEEFESMVALIRNKSFETEPIKVLIHEANLEKSQKGIAELRKIVGAIESRNNVIVSIVLNLLLMWDFQCAKRLKNWKKEYAGDLYNWLELAITFESYASFALYVFGNPSYKYATICENEEVEMINARHILMDEKAVPNTFEIENNERFMIITGANMAGKSTFLRMVGTNMLLAMRGLPVPVESMSFRSTRIFTSMLSADSLGENESYFFNELRRLRQMTDKLENGESLFVILDEILKGTNSIDKAEGSRKFIEKLLNLPVKGIIATHDLSLCDLGIAFPEKVKNMKFEVGFKNDDLDFQYRLESGVCQNMNASFLLKKMGLTE